MKSGSNGRTCLFQGKEVPCELDRIVEALSLPRPVAERATAMCCAVVKERVVRRQPLPLIAASSAYIACRESKTPVTLRELALESRSSPSDIGRCYRSVRDRMQLSLPYPNGATYTSKVASRVKASQEATLLSSEVVSEAVAMGYGDRNPMTLAAAAVYTACLAKGEVVTQSEVAEAAGVSVISVRGCARLMRDILDGLSPGVMT